MTLKTIQNFRLVDGDKLDNAPADINAELDLKEDKVSGKGLSTEDYTTAEKAKVAIAEITTNKGAVDGYAGLDGTGKVPSAQLPAYVDDVLEFADLASFPITGETGIIYIALDTNKTYRWSGSAYVEIVGSIGVWRGEYVGATSYILDDRVSYLGSSYICISPTTGNLPTNVTYWDVLAEKGDTGTAATADAGTTTTLDAGEDATVVNSGTTADAIFDFGIPQGIQGIQGIPGEDGQVLTVEGGTNITVDSTDPSAPIVNADLAGNMEKSIYDTDNSGVVDNSEELGGKTLDEVQDVNKTGFDRRDLTTMGVIELSPDGTNIFGINADGTKYTNASGNFANGTPFQTSAVLQTLAIFPASGETEFSFYVQNTKFTKTALETIALTATSGARVASYNISGVLVETFTSALTYDIFTGNAFISVIYGNAVTQELVLFGDERHGIEMDASTHYYEHFSEGARYVNGLGINGLGVGSGVYTSTSSGVIFDEDIVNNIPVQTNSPFWYRDGTAFRINPDGLDLAEMGTTYPYYNEDLGGGNYQLTEIANTNYVLTHFIATNDSIYPIAKIIGQEEYTNIGLAREGALTEVNNLVLDGLPSPEFRFIGTVICDSNGNLVLTDTGDTFIDWRETNITGQGGTAGVTNLHADLTDTATNGHPASIISNTPAGNIASTTVQGAIDELDTEKAPALGADDNYVTDAEKVVIGNTSGTNTGDQDASEVSVSSTPTNYTASTADVEAHLVGIDTALAGAGGGGIPDVVVTTRLHTVATNTVTFNHNCGVIPSAIFADASLSDDMSSGMWESNGGTQAGSNSSASSGFTFTDGVLRLDVNTSAYTKVSISNVTTTQFDVTYTRVGTPSGTSGITFRLLP